MLRLLVLAAITLTFSSVLAAQAPVPADDRRPLLVTVDDLPLHASLHPDPAERERITAGMLTALARHGVRAVGLVTWGNVASAGDERLLEQWLAAGHELGNHSFRHLDLTRTEVAPYLADVEAARAKLAALLDRHGRTLRFFRYPYLREGDTVAKLEAVRAGLAASGQRDLPVTVDNQDWSFERPFVEAVRAGDAAAATRVGEAYHEAMHVSVRHHEEVGDELAGRRSPQILLLHAGAIGAAEWDRLFTWLETQGHRFAAVDEVLADPLFALPHAFVSPRGCGLWDRLTSERRLADARAQIAALLAEQATAWSRGDLDGFCAVYAEDAVFASPKGLVRGRQAVLDRYRAAYPDAAAMGALTLEVLDLRPVAGTEVSLLGDATPGRVHAASVIARWTLTPAAGETSSGLTHLSLERTPAGWRIVHDASM